MLDTIFLVEVSTGFVVLCQYDHVGSCEALVGPWSSWRLYFLPNHKLPNPCAEVLSCHECTKNFVTGLSNLLLLTCESLRQVPRLQRTCVVAIQQRAWLCHATQLNLAHDTGAE